MRKTSRYLMAAFLLYSAFSLTGCGSDPVSDPISKTENTNSTNSIIESNVQSTVDSSVQSNSEPTESVADSDNIDFDGFKISIDTERA